MCCKQQLAVVRLWCWHCRGLGLTGLVSIETTSCGNYFAPFICCGFSMSYEESDCCNWSRRLWCCTCATVCSTASYHVIWSGYHPALIDNLLQDNSLFVTRAVTFFFGQFHAAGSSKSHWRCIQSFVDWVRQYCGTSEVFVLHVLRCALSLASVLVACAARAETHGCNTGRKNGKVVWFAVGSSGLVPIDPTSCRNSSWLWVLTKILSSRQTFSKRCFPF